MVLIEFLGPINKQSIEVNASSLAEVSSILKEDDSLSPWLDKCAIAINDSLVHNINVELKDGDKISLLPPVCGG